MYEKITGEDPYKAPDDDLSGRPLHHGRPVGGLQPDVQRPRPACAGRSEFLRPRCQPPRRLRPHAGPGRRLFRHPHHHRQLSGHARNPAPSPPTCPSSNKPRPKARERVSKMFSIKGKRTVDSFHRELGMTMWDNCGMARTREGLDRSARQDPANPRGVLEQRAHPRLRRGRQHGTRKSRPRRRLPRIRRNDVLRRPRPRGILRRPLPHRTPVLRNRPGSPSPAAPRPAKPNATTTISPTFPAGNTRAPATPRSSTRNALVYESVHASIRSYA